MNNFEMLANINSIRVMHSVIAFKMSLCYKYFIADIFDKNSFRPLSWRLNKPFRISSLYEV